MNLQQHRLSPSHRNLTNRIALNTLLFVAAVTSTLAQPSAAHAGDWPGWRGPTGIGFTDEKNLPLTWDGKSGENIAWKAKLTGTTGHSSPIVWGDRVFVTTANKQTREEENRKDIPAHHLVCFQASDGKQLWQTEIPRGQEFAGYSIFASPTPAPTARRSTSGSDRQSSRPSISTAASSGITNAAARFISTPASPAAPSSTTTRSS